MRKLALALVGALAGLAIVWLVAMTLPVAALRRLPNCEP